jgi:hypothetical protein
MAIPKIEEGKDSNETLDFAINLTDELKGRMSNGSDDTISNVVWTVPAPLTKASQSNTTSIAQVFIGGGVVGSEYTISAEVTTAGGRVYNRSFILQVVDK